MKHLLGIEDLDDALVDELIEAAKRYKADPTASRELEGKMVALLFFEPSTRTQLSFSAAAQRLGAGVIGFSDPAVTSVSKGETLQDTIRVVQTFCDCIVIRHPRSHSATEAADVATVPIINGGDGANQHPTQTLFDLMTIQEHHDRLSQLRVGFMGDLRWGRTAHSLSRALAHRNNELVWIARDELQMPAEIVESIEAKGGRFQMVEQVSSVIDSLDVLYVTRPQRERWADAFTTQPPVDALSLELLQQANDNMIVLHPLPRTNELPEECDKDHRAKYFDQVANGVPMRMAILAHVLRG